MEGKSFRNIDTVTVTLETRKPHPVFRVAAKNCPGLQNQEVGRPP